MEPAASNFLKPDDHSQSPRLLTVYFGYGSNLSTQQMANRCPKSRFIGIGRLLGYDWIINDRGYANIVEITYERPSRNGILPEVWGLVFELDYEDEVALDIMEGIPYAYIKVDNLIVDFWPAISPGDTKNAIDVNQPSQAVAAMSYVDKKRVLGGNPWPEYIVRMNRGIDDALNMGIPKEYIANLVRKYIPEQQQQQPPA